MAECIAHGVTNIRDSYTEDLSATHRLKNDIGRGEIPGPRIQQAVVVGPSGSYFAEKVNITQRISRFCVGVPTTDHSKKNTGVIEFPVDASEQLVRDTVDRAIDERGAEAIKVGEQLVSTTTFKPDATIMSMTQLSALADQANKRGLKTIIHQITADTFRRAVAASITSLAHITSDTELSQGDIDAFIAADCIIEPTLSVQYDLVWKIKGNRYFDHPDMNRLMNFRDSVFTFDHIGNEFYTDGLRKSLNTAYEKFMTSRFKIFGSIDLSRLYKFYAGMVNYGNTNYRNLFDNGATISASNDAGIPPCTPAMIGLELALSDLILNTSNDVIFNGADAVRMATINSARALGLEDQFGSIAPEKTADLVVLDGDVLEDANVVGKRAAALFMDGKLVINNCGLQVTAL